MGRNGRPQSTALLLAISPRIAFAKSAAGASAGARSSEVSPSLSPWLNFMKTSFGSLLKTSHDDGARPVLLRQGRRPEPLPASPCSTGGRSRCPLRPVFWYVGALASGILSLSAELIFFGWRPYCGF
jgi:hypothetical protein